MQPWRKYLAPSRRNLRSDVDDELRFHVEMLARELISAGTDPSAAHAEAERRFGPVSPIRAACLTIDQRRLRNAAWTDAMTSIGQDLKYVLRALYTKPAFSLIVTLTLALGIGVTTALFSVVDTVLLRPLPYPASERLIALFDVQGPNAGYPAAYAEYRDWAQRSAGTLSDVAAWFGTGEVLSGSGNAEQLSGARISVNLPAILGVTPIAGRTFAADEEPVEGGRVVMLSEGLWRSHFAANPGIVGQAITLTGQRYVVVGIFPSSARAVLPSKWTFAQGKVADFWLPLRLDESESPRSMHWLAVIGRIRPGLTFAQARERLAGMGNSLKKDGVTTHGIEVAPLGAALVGNVKTPLAILLAAVLMLFLIACANVANLLVARGASRRQEFAVRAALGAGRARILILVLTESVVRALLGGLCGVGLAYAVAYAGRRWLVTTVPRMSEVSIDTRVLVFAVAASILCGVVFGLIPAVHAARENLVASLRDGGRGTLGGGTRNRTRRALIVGEIALSFVLLVTGGLLARSFVNLLRVPKGFDPNGLTAMRTWLPSTRYPDSLSQMAFWTRVEDELRQSTGERDITLTSALPVDGGLSGTVSIEGHAPANGADPVAEKRIVGPNYFQVLRAPLARGRSFLATDILGAPRVVIVNEAFARRWLPGENPIGKRVSFGSDAGANAGYETIVGVVADVREGPLDQAPVPAIYMNTQQRASTFLNVVIRSTRPDSAIAAAFRDILRGIDPALPLIDVRHAADVMAASVRQQRLVATILGTFALVALVLATVGLYGVVSFSVGERMQEFGVRAALGAHGGDLLRLVLRQSATYTLVGLSIGLVGASMTARFVSSQLFGITTRDPLVFVVVAALLAAATLIASALPMLRAMRASPLDALRGA